MEKSEKSSLKDFRLHLLPLASIPGPNQWEHHCLGLSQVKLCETSTLGTQAFELWIASIAQNSLHQNESDRQRSVKSPSCMLLRGIKALLKMFANHTHHTHHTSPTQRDPIVSQCFSWISTQRTLALLHLGRSWSSLPLCQLVPLHRLALKTMDIYVELGWKQLDFGQFGIE